MLLAAYLARQCATHSIRRGQIPALLQLSNANKALRRYDVLLAGGLHDADLVARIRACPLLAGDAFEESLDFTRRAIEANARERAMAAELRARRDFRPHLWVIHENTVPSPIFVVAWFGVDTFKRVELPAAVADDPSVGSRLVSLAEWLSDNLRDERYLVSPFGRPTQILYRVTYDHSYVFDVAQRCFTHELNEPPPVGRAFVSIRNSSSIIPIRKGL